MSAPIVPPYAVKVASQLYATLSFLRMTPHRSRQYIVKLQKKIGKRIFGYACALPVMRNSTQIELTWMTTVRMPTAFKMRSFAHDVRNRENKNNSPTVRISEMTIYSVWFRSNRIALSLLLLYPVLPDGMTFC